MNMTIENFNLAKSELQELLSEKSTSESVKKMIQARIKELQEFIFKYSQLNSNYNDFINYLFSDKISSIKNKKIKTYNEKKTLIYSPTQVGKTDAMIRVVKDSISRGISVIISSDNKKDQMDQLVKRLTCATNDDAFEKTLIVMVGSSLNFVNFFEEYTENEYTTFIICCLDNASQIIKVYEKIILVSEESDVEKLLVIHDEGDIINKSRNIELVESGVAKSHKEWINFFTRLTNKSVSMKRIFVSATPENVIVLHKPGQIWSLEIPDNYIGSKDIDYHTITNFDNDKIVKILKNEYKLRKSELGIILYVVERNKNENEDETANQKSVFNYLKNVYNKHMMDALTIYNSDGITVSFRLQKFRKLFIEYLVNNKIKYDQDEDVIIIKKSKMCISDFYKIIQDIGCRMVLTIGKDLISRGISFVSSKKTNPLTATTMIYKPGQTLHQVGLCQAIGRLTGTAQPTLKRRLYSTENVAHEYLNFIKNQKTIIDTIKENGNVVDSDTIEEIVLEKSKRSIDRKKLNINKDFKYLEESSSGSETEFEGASEGRIDGVKLTSLRKWVNDESVVGKMIRYLYDQDKEINAEEFKEGIEYKESMKNLKSNIDNGSSLKAKYGKLWSALKDDNEILLNKNIRKYLDDNDLI